MQAKGEFSKSIEINEKYAKPLWHRLNIRRKEEDYEGAIADAKKIQEIDQEFANKVRIA